MNPVLSALEVWSRIATGSLIAAVWQGAALAAVAAIGLRMLPRISAGVRFSVWFGVFAVIFGLPAVSLLQGHGASLSTSGRGAWMTLGVGWSLLIAGVWVLASTVRAVTLIAAAVRLRTLWKRARPVRMPVGSRPGGLAHGLVRQAQVCVSDEVDRPSVIGFFAPRILMPSWLLEKLTSAELEQVVLHETGHLGRADDWSNLAQKLALVVFPLNLALLWLERRLCFERELACDERVLENTGAPKAYAACLATLAEYRMGRPGISLSLGALGRESELGQRIGRILERGECMPPRQARLVLGAALTAITVGAFALARCPELVTFAADPATAVADTSAVQVHRGQGAAYQAVVFHPRAASLTPIKRVGTENDIARVAPRTVETSVSVPVRAVTTPARRRAAGRLTEQWVVLASWDGEVQTRMIVRMVASPNSAKTRAIPAVSSDGDEHSDQVYPYAAVPVRDGWLVFQM